MTSNDEHIGQILTLKRGGMSQQALAESMRSLGWKWSQATVWSIEKGERPLRLAEAADVAAIVGIDVRDFLLDPVVASYGQELSDAHEGQVKGLEAISLGVLRFLKNTKRLEGLLEEAEVREIDTSEAWISLGITEPGTIEEAVTRGREWFDGDVNRGEHPEEA